MEGNPLMKKGYYLYNENCGSCGVDSKIAMQISEFSKNLDIKAVLIESMPQNLFQRICNLSVFGSIARNYEKAFSELVNPDFIYMRRTYADDALISFIRSIREKFPHCKIIVEIPTYPYDKEMCSSWYTFLIFLKEWYYRKKYYKYIDRFVTYSDDEKIFDVPTIRTMNGISVDKVVMPEKITEYDPENIHMLAVALLAPHHGYERIIRGLHLYYKSESSRKVYFHIVGNGSEQKKYKKLTRRLGLDKYVIFYGEKRGAELDELYRKADIGMAAFGVYKDGFSKLSTLKAREYLAKGLPVVLGAEDNLFNDSEYGLTFPNDSSVVDINRIVTFTDGLYGASNKKDVASKIRKFAELKADNRITLKPVIEYIVSGE